ncbi:MAG: hypothetical protein GDA52_07730 [Rhodobacteraceae bacterium]|nr:hypothetical protein [Paracoccaceae bacterium]
MRKSFAAFAALAMFSTIAGCSPSRYEPVVSAFNGDSVEIEMTVTGPRIGLGPPQMRDEALAKANAMAADICQRGPNKRSEFVSTRTRYVAEYQRIDTRIYLCLNEQ